MKVDKNPNKYSADKLNIHVRKCEIRTFLPCGVIILKDLHFSANRRAWVITTDSYHRGVYPATIPAKLCPTSAKLVLYKQNNTF